MKLKTIVKGDAPTSLVTTGLCRKEVRGKRKKRGMLLFCIRFISNGVFLCFLQPWESQSFCSSFPYEIVCGDSWGQSLLVATDSAGVMLLEGENAFS